MHKKYNGNMRFVQRSIQFDIKHGVKIEEVNAFLDKVKNDSSFSEVRGNAGSGERLELLQI
jgi:hypothetical protein